MQTLFVSPLLSLRGLRAVALSVAAFAAAGLSAFDRANAQSAFEPYVGVLSHSRLDQEQLARLDFIVDRKDGSELKLMAVLSLYFGDFESQEYVSYAFGNVAYNVLTGTLVFDDPGLDVTLVVERFDDGSLEGELRSAVSGPVGRLVLEQGDEVTTTRALVQPLWGEYRSFCNGMSQRLQIQTRRSATGGGPGGASFEAYDLSAQLAEDDPDACLGGDTSSCVRYVYDRGTYDVFAGALTLNGRVSDMSCKVGPEGLSCNGCAYKRHSDEAASRSHFVLPRARASWPTPPAAGGDDPAIAPPTSGLAGTYQGYVFHERLGVYQSAALNLVTFQGPDGDGGQTLKMSAVGTLFFGEHGSAESLAYRFNERAYALTTSQVVFEQLAAGTDAVVQVTSLGGGVAKGIWYSRLYGRVGEFLLQKGSLPVLPSGARRMEGIAGRYGTSTWVAGIKVIRAGGTDSGADPFAPLEFAGHFRLADITANLQIAGGTYDFYTGKIAFELDGGSLFAGTRPGREKLLLKRPTPGTIRPLQPHKPLEFLYLGP